MFFPCLCLSLKLLKEELRLAWLRGDHGGLHRHTGREGHKASLLLEPRNGQGWKGPLWVISSSLAAQAGSPKSTLHTIVSRRFFNLQRGRLHKLSGQCFNAQSFALESKQELQDSKENQYNSLFAFLKSNTPEIRGPEGTGPNIPVAARRGWRLLKPRWPFANAAVCPLPLAAPQRRPRLGTGPSTSPAPSHRPSDTAGKNPGERARLPGPRPAQPGPAGRIRVPPPSFLPSPAAAGALPAPGRVCGSCRRPGLWERRGTRRGEGTRPGPEGSGAGRRRVGRGRGATGAAPARSEQRPARGRPGGAMAGTSSPEAVKKLLENMQGDLRGLSLECRKKFPPVKEVSGAESSRAVLGWAGRQTPCQRGLPGSGRSGAAGVPVLRYPARCRSRWAPTSAAAGCAQPWLCVSRVLWLLFSVRWRGGGRGPGCASRRAGLADRPDRLLAGEAGPAPLRPRRPPGKTQSSAWLCRQHRASESRRRRARRAGTERAEIPTGWLGPSRAVPSPAGPAAAVGAQGPAVSFGSAPCPSLEGCAARAGVPYCSPFHPWLPVWAVRVARHHSPVIWGCVAFQRCGHNRGSLGDAEVWVTFCSSFLKKALNKLIPVGLYVLFLKTWVYAVQPETSVISVSRITLLEQQSEFFLLF